MSGHAKILTEYWLCGNCYTVADMRQWGGSSTTAICPSCGFEHHDDDCSCVYAGTEIEMKRYARELRAEDNGPDSPRGLA